MRRRMHSKLHRSGREMPGIAATRRGKIPWQGISCLTARLARGRLLDRPGRPV